MRRCCLLLVFLAGVSSPARAQADFTGQWAAIYHEDTIERIPGPELGDYTGLPLNEAGRLRVDTDQGTQTRLLHFGARPPQNVEPSWQGNSVAQWEGIVRGPGTPEFAPVALNGRRAGRSKWSPPT
jgi:hypothetical protein